MRRFLALISLFVSMSSFAAPAYPQEDSMDPYMELLRSELRTRKVAAVTEAMMLSKEQSDLFWPIYREYEGEIDKIVDRRLSLMEDFARSYEGMTDEKAGQIVKDWFKIQDDRMKIRKKYHKRFDKSLGSKIAARFLQVEHVISLLIDLQVASETPLIE